MEFQIESQTNNRVLCTQNTAYRRSEDESMKKKVLSAALCLCMLLALLPTVALADGDADQMQFTTAILHDASGVYADDALYDAESYMLTFDITGTALTVKAENLKQHQIAQGAMGYWAGVAVIAPANATQMKAAVSTTSTPSLEGTAATALESRVAVVDGTEYDGVAFYGDAAKTGKLYCAVQWLDDSGAVVTATNETGTADTVYTFTVDFSGVTLAAESDTLPFTDVHTGDWFYAAVAYASGAGMMNGIGDNLFAPDANLTRSMIAQVLYNLEDKPAAGSGAFTDVGDAWYADAVNWAAANGIVSGYGDGTFGPEDDITREQMAVILYNYAKFKGLDVSAQENLTAFSDGASTSGWALVPMQWAVASSLLQGYAGSLNPTGTATRAEVAQILMNFCENITK
jgi:hypothetical protein